MHCLKSSSIYPPPTYEVI